ncbi:MAG: hypothetical protein ACO2ZM_09805 [Francisellaceae bacterium]
MITNNILAKIGALYEHHHYSYKNTELDAKQLTSPSDQILPKILQKAEKLYRFLFDEPLQHQITQPQENRCAELKVNMPEEAQFMLLLIIIDIFEEMVERSDESIDVDRFI